MKKFAKRARLGSLAVASILACATMAQAQSVTLTSADGTVNMTGDFVAFEDNAYIIQTQLGELRVAANRVSCSGAACPVIGEADYDFAISGSDAIGSGLMPLLMEGYAASKDAAAEVDLTGADGALVAKLIADQGFGEDLVSIQIDNASATEGFSDLLEETAQVAMASRRIQPAEARALSAAGSGSMIAPSQEHILAIDSLIVVTNPDNPIGTMDVRQLLGIYSGAITNWSQVGGPDLPVQVVIRNVGGNRQDSFEAGFFGSADVTLTSNAQVVPSSNDVANAVNQNPGAIGVVGFAFQRGANTVNIINQCGITMVPDAFSAKTEEYALQRRLFLYTREDTASPQALDFVNYAASAEADAVIRKAGFIGFSVDRRPQLIGDVRAQALLRPGSAPIETEVGRVMFNTMLEYDRLSTTFRFRTGSSQLDERGLIERERLVDYLENQPAGSEVLLVGFTDDVGPFDANLLLSEQRSSQVLAELQSFAGDRLSGLTLSSTGYGEVAPAGCNASDNGRRINRRVEVWIKAPA